MNKNCCLIAKALKALNYISQGCVIYRLHSITTFKLNFTTTAHNADKLIRTNSTRPFKLRVFIVIDTRLNSILINW